VTIRDYLSREARRITESALSGFREEAAWRAQRPEQLRQFLEMMGLDHYPPPGQRSPLNPQVTGIVQRSSYRIEKLFYQSLPQLYVAANLYIPEPPASGASRQNAGRFPAVLYVCGHSPAQKVEYQAHARRFAELGFVCLIVETIQLGEAPGYHHGCYREGWWHWYSRGYTPGGVELWNGIRGLDLLEQRPEVDPERMGVTGISGGGAVSWYVAAADERIKVAAPVCGTATLVSHIRDRTIDGHCDCMWWNNTYLWDLADLGALIAPRPLMIASADHDSIFTIASIRQVHAQLHRLYGLLGAKENLSLVETLGGHSYHERSRTEIFALFLRHLQGKEILPEQVGDVEETPERQESADTLRVFVNGLLPEDRTPTIQETFLSLATPPQIDDQAGLEQTRQEVVRSLRTRTFRAFPTAPPPLDVRKEFEFEHGRGETCYRFSYTSEEGWRLHGEFHSPPGVAQGAPVVVALRSPEEERWATEQFLGGIQPPHARVILELRGIGDTAWGQDLQWHLRRAAAWTGRTIASMRVWDTLRALEAVRALPEAEGRPLALAARGEMAAIALYAALLDGDLHTLFLEAPPATQNAASRPDGRDPALEMLGCLRITDLPQVAGLLYPMEIVLVGDCPDTYRWAEDLYHRLGAPGKIRRMDHLTGWRP
jgi:cephalosporin-C deacetylase-like acetyl esterase